MNKPWKNVSTHINNGDKNTLDLITPNIDNTRMLNPSNIQYLLLKEVEV